MKVADILNLTDKRLDLKGKVVAVYGSSPETGGVFEDARIVHIGFHPFLVGRIVCQFARETDRWAGVTGAISVGEISRFLIFDTVESARRAFETTEPAETPGEA